MREGSDATEVEHGDPLDRSATGGTVDAAYRGFLFADLRGFTAFVESHGEKAAADLLDAYRALVREQVAKLAGAEVRTEGDSFYVVFPSARSAVACGVEITAAAARHLDLHPDQPIRVGIGINAGEATQHGEGFVGTAVNVAARVCSQARAGEVLVTATVREAVRGTADLRFTARGSPRLKGIAERSRSSRSRLPEAWPCGRHPVGAGRGARAGPLRSPAPSRPPSRLQVARQSSVAG